MQGSGDRLERFFSTSFQGIKGSPSLEGKSFCNAAISDAWESLYPFCLFR